MTRFILRRVFQGIIVLWLITVGVFAIFFIGPGAKQVPRVLAGKDARDQRCIRRDSRGHVGIRSVRA